MGLADENYNHSLDKFTAEIAESAKKKIIEIPPQRSQNPQSIDKWVFYVISVGSVVNLWFSPRTLR